MVFLNKIDGLFLKLKKNPWIAKLSSNSLSIALTGLVLIYMFSWFLIESRDKISAWPIGLQLTVWPIFSFAIYILYRQVGLPRLPASMRTANQLGWVRICVSFSLLALAFKDDISTTLILPEEYAYYWTGPLQYLFQYFPGIFDYRSAGFIQFISIGTRISLLLCLFGVFTRYSLIAGTIFYSLFYYIQILYTHFYSSGFLPLTLLFFLIFMPSGEGLSVDRWLRRKGYLKEAVSSSVDYGAAVFACFSAYGLSYYVCALSKWRLESYWAAANNMKKYIAGDAAALIDNVFGLDLTPLYVQYGGPDVLFLVVGTVALVSETSGLLVLFSRWARMIVPGLLICFHTGTFFLQKFIFPELVLVAFMFIPIEKFWPSEKKAAKTVKKSFSTLRIAICCLLMAHVVAGWLSGLKVYPLSNTWNMYAHSGYAESTWYNFYYLNLRSGEKIKTDLTDKIDFLGQAKWHSISYWPRDEAEKSRLKKLLANYTVVYNQDKEPENQILSIDFSHWVWDFVNDAASPTHGNISKTLRYDIHSGTLTLL